MSIDFAHIRDRLHEATEARIVELEAQVQDLQARIDGMVKSRDDAINDWRKLKNAILPDSSTDEALARLAELKRREGIGVREMLEEYWAAADKEQAAREMPVCQ